MICPYETEVCRKDVHCAMCSHYVEPEGITTKSCKTNADYIRSLTNEEMAEWLVYKVKCMACDAENCESKFCVNLMKQWLEDLCE